MLFLMKIADADDAELDSTVCIVYHERREKERVCPDNCLFRVLHTEFHDMLP